MFLNFCHNAVYHNSCPEGLAHFGQYPQSFQNCCSHFGHFLQANAMFFDAELFCHICIAIRIAMQARLGQLETKCLFKVQYLNNQLFSFVVKFCIIMTTSSRKCVVVTDHEKFIATHSKKDRALRGAWDILNEVPRGAAQAEKKWVIPKKHIACYLKKVKEDAVCIQMKVNASQPQESTPRRQEYVKVDPWDLYVQAYQWAGQEVGKGKLSCRKAASEVYLRFGVNLFHNTFAKAAEDEDAPPKRRGKATFVPPDVECELVDFCIALRSLTFAIFTEGLIAYCNNLLTSLFNHGELRDSWYYNWLRRYHDKLGTMAAKPLEVDRE